MMKKLFMTFVALLAIAAGATGFSGTARAQSTNTLTDTITREWTGVTGNSYQLWEDVVSPATDAVYAGQSAGGNDAIQLRSNSNNSGIVTTTSGGKVASVTVVWNSNTQSNRTLQVYGKNSAYSDASDLYSGNEGTLLGQIVYGTSTSLTITGDYEYIGLRSLSGAMYLDEIRIEWIVPQQGSGSQGGGTNAEPQEYTLDSIPATWTVRVGGGEAQSPTAYAEDNPQKGYASIPEGASVELIPSAADKNLIKSIALVDNSVPAGPAFNNVAGTFEWTVGNESSATVSDSIQEAISATGVTVGSGLTNNGTTSYDVTQMVKYQPQTSNAGVVAGVMVEYRIETVGGVKFSPTAIEYAAMKLGTDDVSYSWSYTLDGVESSIATVTKDDILRSNGNNSSTSQLMHSATLTATECDVFTLRFYVSGFPSTKQMGLGKVTISGTVNGVASGN